MVLQPFGVPSTSSLCSVGGHPFRNVKDCVPQSFTFTFLHSSQKYTLHNDAHIVFCSFFIFVVSVCYGFLGDGLCCVRLEASLEGSLPGARHDGHGLLFHKNCLGSS